MGCSLRRGSAFQPYGGRGTTPPPASVAAAAAAGAAGPLSQWPLEVLQLGLARAAAVSHITTSTKIQENLELLLRCSRICCPAAAAVFLAFAAVGRGVCCSLIWHAPQAAGGRGCALQSAASVCWPGCLITQLDKALYIRAIDVFQQCTHLMQHGCRRATTPTRCGPWRMPCNGLECYVCCREYDTESFRRCKTAD